MQRGIDLPSMADRAYYAIRNMIVSLELAPGAVVDEPALMHRLSLGRTPTREALQRLARERLVEIYPRRGIVVTRVGLGDLGELSEARITLEGKAAHLAARRATQTDCVRLELLVEEFAPTELDQDQLMQIDERFHRTIAEAAMNRFLAAAIAEHYVHSLRIWHLALEHADELGGAIEQLCGVAQAVLEGHGNRARALMRDHILGFERSLRDALA